MTRARQQEAIEANYQFVESRGLLARLNEAVHASVCKVLVPMRHVAWAGNMNNCFVTAYGTTRTVMPIQTRPSSVCASQLARRKQPCDSVWPTFAGSGVPWIP